MGHQAGGPRASGPSSPPPKKYHDLDINSTYLDKCALDFSFYEGTEIHLSCRFFQW